MASLEQVIYQAANDRDFRQAINVNVHQALASRDWDLDPEELAALGKASLTSLRNVQLQAELWPTPLD